MTPRQARRERREAERKAKKLELKTFRQANGAGAPRCPEPSRDRMERSTDAPTRPAENQPPATRKEFPEIQPRWNPALEDEFPREEQIRNNLMADRIALQAGLPTPPAGEFSSLEEMRAYYLAKRKPADMADAHSRPGKTTEPADPPAENGFVSQKRAETNRANAQLSTGPKTPLGKLASSRNSTKHGLTSGQLIIPGEDPAEFDSLVAALLEDHQPAGETEELLVTEMAQSHWLAQRAIRLQNGCFRETGVDEKGLSLFLRFSPPTTAPSTKRSTIYNACKRKDENPSVASFRKPLLQPRQPLAPFRKTHSASTANTSSFSKTPRQPRSKMASFRKMNPRTPPKPVSP